jgi:transaldolase
VSATSYRSPLRFRSPLHEMACTTPTAYWNDSCSPRELRYALEHGAVGATSNPVIVGTVLQQDLVHWREPIRGLVAELAHATEDELAWRVCEQVSLHGARLLEDIFARGGGRDGRMSIQTDPRCYRDAERMVAQAVRFAALAPNLIVKLPVTAAGLTAIEEATYRGISINGTVSFSVAQAVQVAEAVERGLRRREAEGKPIADMGPIATIMVGRLDDWLKTVMERDDVITNPGYLEWAGVAVIKRAYRIFQERGYRLRLLAAAYRNHLHWSELIGGELVVSMPHQWQVRFNASDVAVTSRIDDPVAPTILDALLGKFPDFRRAYEEQGLSAADFDGFGPTVRTLRQFIAGYHDLVATVRDFMLVEPD